MFHKEYGIIQTFMKFDGTVEVNETDKSNAVISVVFKLNLAICHIFIRVRMLRSALPLILEVH